MINRDWGKLIFVSTSWLQNIVSPQFFPVTPVTCLASALFAQNQFLGNNFQNLHVQTVKAILGKYGVATEMTTIWASFTPNTQSQEHLKMTSSKQLACFQPGVPCLLLTSSLEFSSWCNECSGTDTKTQGALLTCPTWSSQNDHSSQRLVHCLFTPKEHTLACHCHC